MLRRYGLRLLVYLAAGGIATALVVGGWQARRASEAQECRNRAWQALRFRDGPEAVAQATRLLEIRPEAPESHLLLGLALAGRAALERSSGDPATASGTTSAAAAALANAMDLGASDRAFLVDAAGELLRAGDPARALSAIDRALALGRGAEALRLRAMATVAVAQGHAGAINVQVLASAAGDCAAALPLAPDAMTVMRVAMTARDLGDESLMAPAAARVAQLDSSDPLGPFLTGLAAERAGAHASADAAFSRALELLAARERRAVDPPDDTLDQWRRLAAELYCRRGRARLGLDRAPEAADDCDRALRLEPAWDEAYHVGARAFLRAGRPNDADTALTRAWKYSGPERRAVIGDEIERGEWDSLPEGGARVTLTQSNGAESEAPGK